MGTNIIHILIGALIASIVPLVTLYLNHNRWKIEKKVETLRAKHDRLERIYMDILDNFPKDMVQRNYSTKYTSSIMVYGSKEVQEIFSSHIKKENKDELTFKYDYMSLSVAMKQHLADIEHEIEKSLS
jgi:hypothetical protein